MRYTILPDELARRIAGREGRTLELKEGLGSDEKLARVLCAFANTRGGLLVVGVGDGGEILGAPRPRASQERLRAIASEHVEPPLAIECGTARLAGRTLLWVSVPISPRRPHSFAGVGGARELVVRVGSRNRSASTAALAEIAAERARAAEPSDLERDVLAWLARERAPVAGVARFAAERAVGVQRARQAFLVLELAGLLVGHGVGEERVYELSVRTPGR